MIDLFSEGITIKVKKDPKIKTNVGCVLTLILIVLVIVYAVFALINMTKRDVVFTTFSTQFQDTVNDPSLGTLSSVSVPLEAAHIISDISWFDSSNNLPKDSASFGTTDFSVTDWAGIDFSCSPEMKKNLLLEGYNLNNVICVKLDLFENETQSSEIKMLKRDPDRFDFTLYKICRLTPKLDLGNYEKPFDWSLVCKDYGRNVFTAASVFSSFYSVNYISLDTDDNYFGTSSKKEYVRYLDPYKDYYNNLGDGSFYTVYKLEPKYDSISRRFQKITDVIASINGIYGLLLLVMIILGRSCIDIEQKAKLFRYLSSKKDLGLKDGNISTWDIFNAKLFRSKKAQEKVNAMDRFYVENIEDKLELSNIANFEGPVVILNSPKGEERDLLKS